MPDESHETSENLQGDLSGNFGLLANELGEVSLAHPLVTAYATVNQEERAGAIKAALDQRLDAINLEHEPDAEA